jgi:hypothetical protein
MNLTSEKRNNRGEFGRRQTNAHLLSIAINSFVQERLGQYPNHLKVIQVVIPSKPLLRSENGVPHFSPTLREAGVSETPPLLALLLEHYPRQSLWFVFPVLAYGIKTFELRNFFAPAKIWGPVRSAKLGRPPGIGR